MEINIDQLVGTAKHVPRLLRQQLLSKLMGKYVADDGSNNFDSSQGIICEPSINRFHGALLFVDISGFTSLSLKLDVEALKNVINDYFSKMLDIVDKWDGDVVKFAGDALFIVWPTAITESEGCRTAEHTIKSGRVTEHDSFATAARAALEKATACGLEIGAFCGNYEVKISEPIETSPSKGLLSKLIPNFSFGGFLNGKVAPSSYAGEDIVYLNVHAGVSCGLMAGIDLVTTYRSEFFLIGEPLTGVAMAESQASKGDVVLDFAAHELLHGDNIALAIKGQLGEQNVEVITAANVQMKPSSESCLLCGCSRTKDGMYLVSKLLIRAPKANDGRKQRKQRKMKSDSKTSPSKLAEQHTKIFDSVQRDVDMLFSSTQSLMKKEVISVAGNGSEVNPWQSFDFSSIPGFRSSKAHIGTFLDQVVKKHFVEWMNHSLLDNLLLHVHEVVRNLSIASPKPVRRMSSFRELIMDSFSESGSSRSHSVRSDYSEDRISHSVSTGPNDSEDIPVFPLSSTNENKERRASHVNVHYGELRSVVVMFVKIENLDLRLFVDPTGKSRKFSYSRFSFLDCTDQEVQADSILLAQFQKCFEEITCSLSEHGGQMRQFVVDDKGTVCIGTFGLLGSATADSAAAAVQCSLQIVEKLSSMQLAVSIGVTSGKAYCGLVGSSIRHEYAVMGPSTNLSARLMCKASLNGILCDGEVMARDRRHKFGFVAEIQAKGYPSLVSTYQPVGAANHSDRSLGRSYSFHRSIEESSYRRHPSGVLKSALHGKLSLRQKLLMLSDSQFVDANQELIRRAKEGTTWKLYGREDVIQELLVYLIEEDNANTSSVRVSGPVKMAVVCGSFGTGKSAILTTVAENLKSLARMDAHFNVEVTTMKPSFDVPATNMAGSLKPWISVVQRLALVLTRSHTSGDRSARSHHSGEKFSSPHAATQLIQGVMRHLAKSGQEVENALLMLLSPQESRQQVISEAQMDTIAMIIAALLNATVNVTRKLVILIM